MRHRNRSSDGIKTGRPPRSGKSIAVTYLLAIRCPVYRQRDFHLGFDTELENLIGAGKGKGSSRQQIGSVFWSRNGLKPCGHLVMPAEIMASYLLIVLGGERHQSIRMSEVVTVRFRMNQQPFHVVLGYENARLLPQKRRVIRELELPKGNCTPDQEVFLSTCRPKRLGRR